MLTAGANAILLNSDWPRGPRPQVHIRGFKIWADDFVEKKNHASRRFFERITSDFYRLVEDIVC